MVNYKYGKIYKIIGNGYTYVGSTCKPLKKRLNGHIYAYNRYKNNNRNAYTSSFKCFEGENKYDIVLLENFHVIIRMSYLQEKHILLEN